MDIYSAVFQFLNVAIFQRQEAFRNKALVADGKKFSETR